MAWTLGSQGKVSTSLRITLLILLLSALATAGFFLSKPQSTPSLDRSKRESLPVQMSEPFPEGAQSRLASEESKAIELGESTRTTIAPPSEVQAIPSDVGTVPGAIVRGRVVDDTGLAMSGALVVALGESENSPDSVSGADGVFECRGVHPGRVSLYVTAEGMRTEDVDLGVLRDGEVRDGVEIRLEPRPPITGRVQWPNGNPAAGCVVLYSPELDSHMSFSDEPVTCDELGSFRIVAPIDRKPMSLTAYWPTDKEAPASASKAVFSWVAHRDDVEQGTSGLVLTLVPSSKLQVRVLDESGTALETSSVYAVPYCRDHPFRNHEFKGRGLVNDATGELVIQGLHDGRWLLIAEAPDHVEFEWWVDLPRDAGSLEITLQRTLVLSGVVVDPTGVPSPKAAIFLLLRSIDKRFGGDRERVVGRDSADGEGRFELRQVPPGHLIVEAYSEDRTLRTWTEIDVDSGSPPPEFRLVLRTKAETPEMDRPRGQPLRR